MTDERFERIELALEQTQQLLLGLARNQSDTSDRVTRLADAVDLLVQVSGQQSQAINQLIDSQQQTFARMDVMQAEIREIQSDVRGLQTENRRILDVLLGEAEDEE